VKWRVISVVVVKFECLINGRTILEEKEKIDSRDGGKANFIVEL
jgi:hypothetical protein